jgi:uncharacterized membrane protein
MLQAVMSALVQKKDSGFLKSLVVMCLSHYCYKSLALLLMLVYYLFFVLVLDERNNSKTKAFLLFFSFSQVQRSTRFKNGKPEDSLGLLGKKRSFEINKVGQSYVSRLNNRQACRILQC